MSIENFGQQNNLSEEQQERQEKFVELLEIMSSLSKSFDSNEAYEVAASINDFKKEFEDKDFELKDYLLGGVLLSSEDTFDLTNYKYFDTEDGEIEKFIRNLKSSRE